MLLLRLRTTVLAAASILGTSWAWPAALSTDAGPIEVASTGDDNGPSLSTGSISVRTPHGAELDHHTSALTLAKALTKPHESKRRLARRASRTPMADSAMLIDDLWLTLNEYEEYLIKWGQCSGDRFRIFVSYLAVLQRFTINEATLKIICGFLARSVAREAKSYHTGAREVVCRSILHETTRDGSDDSPAMRGRWVGRASLADRWERLARTSNLA